MEKYLLLLAAYPLFGIPLAICHWILRVTGLLEVQGWGNFPSRPEKILLVSNHPSKNIQPLLTVGLFSHAYLVNPVKYAPYAVADKHNFYDRLVFRPVRSWIIPVNRKNPNDDKCIRIAKEVANKKGNQIWFPEGTRSWKARFTVRSPKGKILGELKPGFARIVEKFDYTVVPVWYETKGFKVTMKIGRPMRFVTHDLKEVTSRVQSVLLELADAS